MNILILETDKSEQDLISRLLNNTHEIHYTNSVMKAIHMLGVREMDFVFIDSDYQKRIANWKDLESFLLKLEIPYAIFSSNGKVGKKVGKKKIISIYDLPKRLDQPVL